MARRWSGSSPGPGGSRSGGARGGDFGGSGQAGQDKLIGGKRSRRSFDAGLAGRLAGWIRRRHRLRRGSPLYGLLIERALHHDLGLIEGPAPWPSGRKPPPDTYDGHCLIPQATAISRSVQSLSCESPWDTSVIEVEYEHFCYWSPTSRENPAEATCQAPIHIWPAAAKQAQIARSFTLPASVPMPHSSLRKLSLCTVI